MAIKTKTFLKKGLTLFFSVMSFFMFGQNTEEPEIRKVFNPVVLAYRSAKTASELLVTKQTQNRPSFYKCDKKPVVTIDTYLFTICKSFGKDSLNALSVVIGHELAHYYNEHSFCTDFAFAIRNKNEVFSKKVKLIDKNQKIIYETQADDKGLFFAAIAGYEPFEVQPKLLDAVYTQYQLKDTHGYPTKVQRKEIAKNALLKAKRLFDTFRLGLKYMQEKKYDKAIEAFNTVNNDFPSRENYNNLGVAKTRKVLLLKVNTREEYKYPDRFLYPLEIENKSRLNQEVTRGINDDNKIQMEKYLKEAQMNFQEAIRLDPNFTKGYINLASVFDLLGNSEAALGIIKELPKDIQNQESAKRIKAIAYHHLELETKALEIWRELGI